MKIQDIPFEDAALREAVMALGVEDPDAVVTLRARKQAIKSAKGIEYLPKLKLLDLTRNLLSEIDLSGNPELEELYLGNNQLERLELHGNPKLKHLEVFMNDIDALDLRHLNQLESLYAGSTDLKNLDLSGNPVLAELQINDTGVAALTFASTPKLFKVSAKNNAFPEALKQQLQTLVAPEYLHL